MMDRDVREPKSLKAEGRRPKTPEVVDRAGVESPQERQKRVFLDALAPNPRLSASDRAQSDVDRIFGRTQLEKDGTTWGNWRARFDYLRTAPGRRGESLAPDFDSIPVRMAMIQGDRAAQDLAILGTLSNRGEQALGKKGSAAQIRDELIADVTQAEAEGLISHEDAAAKRDEIQLRYDQEIVALAAVLQEMDARNQALGEMARRHELALADAGALALARGSAMDAAIQEHFHQALAVPHEEYRPEAARVALAERLDLIIQNDPSRLDRPQAEACLLEARVEANRMAQELLVHVDVFKPLDAFHPERVAFEAARAEFLRVRSLRDALPEGGLDGKVRAAAADRLQQIEDRPEQAFDILREAVQDRYDELWDLQCPDVVNQQTIEMVGDLQLRGEAEETEVLLALEARDQATLAFLVAAERYLARYEERVPGGLPLEIEQRIPASREVREAYQPLLAARATGVEVRALEAARSDNEVRFREDAVAFIDRHLPLLEVPDNLPGLEIARLQAAVVSGNMGSVEAWKRLSDVEARDLKESSARMFAYWSIVQNSVAGKSLGYVTHLGIVTTEHAAAMAWVIAQTLAKVTTSHLTDLGKSVGTGKDAQAGISAAMEIFAVGGSSIGQAWAGLKLAQGVRNQRIQIQMQRRQEMRERLDNRKKEIGDIVKNNRDGAELMSSYLDQGKQLRDQVKGVVQAEPFQREKTLAQALGTMESMQHKLQMMKLDHPDMYERFTKSPELSVIALRRAASKALAQNGLVKEASAFDEREAQRAHLVSNVGRIDVHLAVDAASHLRDLLTAKDRMPDALNEEVRMLISERGFGSHGNLAGGLMAVDSDKGPMGILFHPGNPPGVALVPLRTGEDGAFQGFADKPRVFDLADPDRSRDGGIPPQVLLESFPVWAREQGLGNEKVAAMQAYLAACVEFKGLPLQSSLPQSHAYLDDLKKSGILTVPTALDDGSLMPVNATLEAYWNNQVGRGPDTAKLQAALETASLNAWDQSIARQSVVAAIRARWRLQEANAQTAQPIT